MNTSKEIKKDNNMLYNNIEIEEFTHINCPSFNSNCVVREESEELLATVDNPSIDDSNKEQTVGLVAISLGIILLIVAIAKMLSKKDKKK